MAAVIDPEPTLAEIAAHLRSQSEFHLSMVEFVTERGLPWRVEDHMAKAAWHEAAARQLEALAGQAEEANFHRSVMLAVLGQFYQNYQPGSNRELDEAWAEAGALTRNETPARLKLNRG